MNTLPEPTLNAFAEHGDASHAITRDDEAEAEEALAAIGEAGVDLKAVTDQLLIDGLDAFEADFLALLRCIDEALTRDPLRQRPQRGPASAPIEDAAGEALDRLAREDVAGRLPGGRPHAVGGRPGRHQQPPRLADGARRLHRPRRGDRGVRCRGCR